MQSSLQMTSQEKPKARQSKAYELIVEIVVRNPELIGAVNMLS